MEDGDGVRLSKSLSLFSLQASEAARHFAHLGSGGEKLREQVVFTI